MKTYFKILIVFSLITSITVNAQRGIGTSNPNADAILELKSTNKGFLLPRVSLQSTSSPSPLSAHVAGMTVYNTATIADVSPGYFINDGTKWIEVISKGYQYNGNSIFIGPESGTVNTGNRNTGFGYQALKENTTGTTNVAIGHMALKDNTTGYRNTGVGDLALFTNTTAFQNTAIGSTAMYNNTTGNANTAIGASSLQSNQTGGYNVAVGLHSLLANKTGSNNVGVGISSLNNNQSGEYNVAIGSGTLSMHVTSNYNTALGNQAMLNTTTGASNVAIGNQAMQNTINVSNNVALGEQAMRQTSYGNSNVALGHHTLESAIYSHNNVAIGAYALRDGDDTADNVAIGHSAQIGVRGSRNITIGAQNYQNSIGNNNIIIGHKINLEDPHGDNQLSIGNLIFAKGGFAEGTDIGSGMVSIGMRPDESYSDDGLQVDGNIRLFGWPNEYRRADYVFEKYYNGSSKLKPSYKMASLKTIEEFTKKNHHLPGVPSAAEIKKNGLVLNQATNLNLEKIEELFLHLIKQEKTIKAQKERITNLESRLLKLEEKVN